MVTRLTFGEWLSDRMYAAGYNQPSLAAALGMNSASTVNNWINGGNFPGPRVQPELARLLGVDRDELIRRIADEKSASNVTGRPKEVRRAPKRITIQLYPRVPASVPTWIAMESERRMIELPEDWLRDVRPDAIAVEVNGDCLIARGIHNGDLVICEPPIDPTAIPQNKVVLIRVEDEYTLKVWRWTGDDTAELRDGNGAVIATLNSDVDFQVIGIARKRFGNVL